MVEKAASVLFGPCENASNLFNQKETVVYKLFNAAAGTGCLGGAAWPWSPLSMRDSPHIRWGAGIYLRAGGRGI